MQTMTKPTQGELIARQRAALGISQNGLAKQIGKTHTAVWGVEAGRTKLTAPETIGRTAEALDLETDDLYAGGDLIPPDIEAAIRALDAGELGQLRAWLAGLREEEGSGE